MFKLFFDIIAFSFVALLGFTAWQLLDLLLYLLR